ncbi:MAG: MFS transporter [Anaerolineae bacterium]|nr:MFS transporter [Anaerolineae bacterium]
MKAKRGDSVGYGALLRGNRNFRLLWGGQIVSLLGDWFNLIASALLIAQLTGSGAAVGGLFVVRFLAPFLVSPFAGVAADRYNRKHLLILTDILRGITVIGFLFINSPQLVWLVYALTAIQMAGQGFFFPARNAILPDIVNQRELGAANALSSATWSIMLAFGAALGGVFSGIWGIYPAFILDALTFFISAGILSRIAYTPPVALAASDKSIKGALTQYFDGLKYLRQHVDIFWIATHKAANGLFVAGAFQVIQVTIAESYFPIGEGGGTSLGLIYVATGIGTGLGPILARYFTGDRIKLLRYAILVGYFSSITGLVVTSTLSNFPVVLIGAFLRGFGGGTMWVLSTQLLMQLVPVEVRGRVFSTEFALSTLSSAIAAGVAGALLDTVFSISEILQMLSVLTLIPTGLWLLWTLFGKHEKLKTASTLPDVMLTDS